MFFFMEEEGGGLVRITFGLVHCILIGCQRGLKNSFFVLRERPQNISPNIFNLEAIIFIIMALGIRTN